MSVLIGDAVRGVISFVNAVYVHIGFAKPAIDQVIDTTGRTPKAHTEQQIGTHVTADNCGTEVTADRFRPVCTAVIGEGHQRIELVLLQIQRILLDELIHSRLKAGQLLMQKIQRFLFRDVMIQIVLQSVVRATGTVADSVLLVVPCGTPVEALHGLQNLYKLLGGGKVIICSRRPDRRAGEHGDQHRHRQQSAYPSFLHKRRSFPLFWMMPL